MMNELQIFNNEEFGEIRTVEIDNEIWFVGRDIALALGYAKPWNAIDRHVDSEDTLKRGIPHPQSLGKEIEATLINESGLYTLVIMSELPSAKKFKRWVTKEVIPSIMKTGSYNLPQITQAELILQMAQSHVQLERRMDSVERTVQESQTKLETTLKTFSAPSTDTWKNDMEDIINNLVEICNLNPIVFRGQLYREVDYNGVSLNNRLLRMRKRLKKQGVTYRDQMAVTKLDIISKDKQLRAVFEGIVKKYQALYDMK